jgi:hypothetical protein
MKASIKLAALFLLASTGLFAATPATKAHRVILPATDAVVFSTLSASRGIAVSVGKNEPGKAIVVIYDNDKNVLRKDVLASGGVERGYVLNTLENGDYTIEVTTSNHVVKKAIHVYNEGENKMFFIKG